VTYGLGVDLGTTFTAAAVARDGVVEMFNLGSAAAAIPSVVLLEEGTFLIGEVADQRSGASPVASAREFKRRIGDPAPVLVNGSPYAPHLLLGRLLAGVLAAVSEREGGPPSHIALTHPANWGEYRRELFVQMARSECGAAALEFLTEPEAAAIDYANRAPVPDGSSIAVYDLGGGTFDAAILRRDGDHFTFLGSPEGVDHLGGLDFDAALLNLVAEQAGLDHLDPDDTSTIAAMHQLRRACVEAKITLSTSTDATVPVFVPGARATAIRVTRAEFEELIGPSLDESVRSLQRAVAGAGLDPTDLHSVLLVGGSSRVPLVAQHVTSALARPVAVDADPKNAIARGAARKAMLEASTPSPTTPPVVPPPVSPTRADAADENRRSSRRAPLLIGAAALIAVVVIATVVTTLGDGGEDAQATGVPLCVPNSTDGTFSVGVAASKTGVKSDLTGIESGALLAIEDINEAGGVLGRPIEATVVDSGDADATGVSAFSRLDGDDADLVIGPTTSSMTRAIAPSLSEQCMLTISASATATDLAALDDDNLFYRTIGTTGDEARLIVEDVGVEGRVTLIDAGGDFSAELRGDLEDQAGRIGSSFESVDAVGEIDPAEVGTVVLSADNPFTDISDLVDLGVPANKIVLVEVDLASVLNDLPDRTADLVGLSMIAPGAGLPSELASRVSDQGVVGLYTPEAYDAVVIAALAAESGSTDDPAQIASRLGAVTGDVGTKCRSYADCVELIGEGVDISYEGFLPTLIFDSDGDPGRATFFTQTVEADGQIVQDLVVAERPR